MSAVAMIQPEFEDYLVTSEPTALQRSVEALADLFVHCERLHRANIQHDPLSCVICFEER